MPEPQNKDPYRRAEALKFLSSRMSHYAYVGRHFPSQSITFSGECLRCIIWLLLLASKLQFLHKKRGPVAPLSGPSVTDLYSVPEPTSIPGKTSLEKE